MGKSRFPSISAKQKIYRIDFKEGAIGVCTALDKWLPTFYIVS